MLNLDIKNIDIKYGILISKISMLKANISMQNITNRLLLLLYQYKKISILNNVYIYLLKVDSIVIIY